MSLLHHILRHKKVDLSHFVPVLVCSEQIGWTKRDFAKTIAGFSPNWHFADNMLWLDPSLADFDSRSAFIDECFNDMADQGLIKVSPVYPIVDWMPVGKNRQKPLFKMRRFYGSLLGIKTHSVVVNAFDHEGMWLSIRGAGVDMAPGKLDMLLAGRVTLGQSLDDALILEGHEEAGLAHDFVHKIKPVGIIPLFFHQSDGFLSDEILFMYDFFTPSDFKPHSDQTWEVAGFRKMPIAAIMTMLEKTDDFKSQAAFTMVDFMMRHGHMPFDYPDYVEMAALIKGTYKDLQQP